MGLTLEQKEKQLRRLFFEQEGKCKICGKAAYLEMPKHKPLAAVRFRTGSSYGEPGRTRPRVMVHRKCAQERSDQITLSQPIEVLWHLSKRQPTEFYEACSSTEELSAHNTLVAGSTPAAPTKFATLAQMAERPICNGEDAGSTPAGSSNSAPLAQRTEHEDSTLGVAGSNPAGRAITPADHQPTEKTEASQS
jgi:hypothetical protein